MRKKCEKMRKSGPRPPQKMSNKVIPDPRIFPSCVQEASKLRPRGPRGAQEAPKTPQERPKSVPRAAKSAPKPPKSARKAPKSDSRATKTCQGIPKFHQRYFFIRFFVFFNMFFCVFPCFVVFFYFNLVF